MKPYCDARGVSYGRNYSKRRIALAQPSRYLVRLFKKASNIYYAFTLIKLLACIPD